MLSFFADDVRLWRCSTNVKEVMGKNLKISLALAAAVVAPS